jgi:hypothetical protein
MGVLNLFDPEKGVVVKSFKDMGICLRPFSFSADGEIDFCDS